MISLWFAAFSSSTRVEISETFGRSVANLLSSETNARLSLSFSCSAVFSLLSRLVFSSWRQSICLMNASFELFSSPSRSSRPITEGATLDSSDFHLAASFRASSSLRACSWVLEESCWFAADKESIRVCWRATSWSSWRCRDWSGSTCAASSRPADSREPTRSFSEAFSVVRDPFSDFHLLSWRACDSCFLISSKFASFSWSILAWNSAWTPARSFEVDRVSDSGWEFSWAICSCSACSSPDCCSWVFFRRLCLAVRSSSCLFRVLSESLNWLFSSVSCFRFVLRPVFSILSFSLSCISLLLFSFSSWFLRSISATLSAVVLLVWALDSGSW